MLLIRGSTRVNAPTTTGEKRIEYASVESSRAADPAILGVRLRVSSSDTRSTSRQDNRVDRSTVIRHLYFVRCLRLRTTAPRHTTEAGSTGGRGLIRLEDSPYVHAVSFLYAVHQRSSTSSDRDESSDFMATPNWELCTLWFSFSSI